MVKKLHRLLLHAVTGRYHVQRLIPAREQARITKAIGELEKKTTGELRVVIEGSLDIFSLLMGRSARHRAEAIFARERIWDTHNNNGVLLYLLVAERDAEIVADRGLNGKVSPEEWSAVCRGLEYEVKRVGFVPALIATIESISTLLERAFPGGEGRGELPDEVILR
jgi:uncharacterized membrane protein